MTCSPSPTQSHQKSWNHSKLPIFFHKISHRLSISQILSSFPSFLTLALVCFLLETVSRVFSLLSFSSTFKQSVTSAGRESFLKCKSNYIILCLKQPFQPSPRSTPLSLRAKYNSQAWSRWPLPHPLQHPQPTLLSLRLAFPSPVVSASATPFSSSLPS